MVRSGCAECVEDVDGPVTEVAVGGGDVGATAEPDDDRGVVQGGHDLWYSGKPTATADRSRYSTIQGAFRCVYQWCGDGWTDDLTAARSAVAGWTESLADPWIHGSRC